MALTNSDLPKLVELLNLIDIRVKVRRKTAAEWTASNEVLLSGEWGKETDTGKLKQGDGVTVWNDLAYYSTGTALGPDNAGANIDIDATDPDVPIISSSLGYITIKGRVANYASLPSSGNTSGDAYVVDTDKLIYVWDGSAWPDDGEGVGQGYDFSSSTKFDDLIENITTSTASGTSFVTNTTRPVGYTSTGSFSNSVLIPDALGALGFNCQTSGYPQLYLRPPVGFRLSDAGRICRVRARFRATIGINSTNDRSLRMGYRNALTGSPTGEVCVYCKYVDTGGNFAIMVNGTVVATSSILFDSFAVGAMCTLELVIDTSTGLTQVLLNNSIILTHTITLPNAETAPMMRWQCESLGVNAVTCYLDYLSEAIKIQGRI